MRRGPLRSPALFRRRDVLRGARNLTLLALLPRDAIAAATDAQRAAPGAAGVFLDAAELDCLRALCAHFIPGPPRDPDPGAAEAGAADYIDLMLGAFTQTPPPLFAGGPFSLRDGDGHNSFADFIPLDALEERIWRTRIEGSRGLPEREWNGPVIGWQERYRAGLAELDRASQRLGAARFSELSERRARWLLRLAWGELGEFLDLAFQHTVEGTYGPPEYGGNRGRVGWTYTQWPGDHQPHHYSDAQISEPDANEADAVAKARGAAREAREGETPEPRVPDPGPAPRLAATRPAHTGERT
jgi:gluconate 2-dehydrogenase gamma chain